MLIEISDSRLTIVGFGLTRKYEELGKPKILDCVGYLSENYFNGANGFRFELVDFTTKA